ncbi:MAG: CRISPR-associated RAMP protein [Chloroflexaceae bacterium]|nr:CRISPR-associated RAMP protein [Chloroflexaceae bacterium]
MSPVFTMRHGERQVYIPGSSLKGVFRSHTEKIIRTLRPGETVVADPFEKNGDNQSCSTWFNERKEGEKLTNEIVYTDSCPVHRLFGSTYFIGRVSIGDAYLVDENGAYLDRNTPQAKREPTENRDGVGIDRLTGGSSPGALFSLEVVSSGTRFRTEVLLRNFECWQLGALLLVVQDMEDELVRLGSGKSRGLGAVRGTVDEVVVHHLGPTPGRADTELWGLGQFLGNDSPYGTKPDDTLTVQVAPATANKGIRAVQTFENESLQALKEQAVPEFIRRMDAFPAYKSAYENRQRGT